MRTRTQHIFRWCPFPCSSVLLNYITTFPRQDLLIQKYFIRSQNRCRNSIDGAATRNVGRWLRWQSCLVFSSPIHPRVVCSGGLATLANGECRREEFREECVQKGCEGHLCSLMVRSAPQLECSHAASALQSGR